MQPATPGSPTILGLLQALPSQAACITLSHKHKPALTPPHSMYQILTLMDQIVPTQAFNVMEKCPLTITIHTMLQTQSTWTCIDNSGQRFIQISSTVYINVMRSIIHQGMVSQVYRSMVTIHATWGQFTPWDRTLLMALMEAQIHGSWTLSQEHPQPMEV